MSFLGIKIKNPFRTGAGGVAREAAAGAAARQGRANNFTMAADNWFNDPNRANQRDQFMTALRGNLADNTNREFTRQARRTKFATARQGLTGGRVDVDRQGRDLEDLFQRRLSDEAQVQDAGNTLRTQDLATRQSIIDAAYGGADIGRTPTQTFLGQQADSAAYLRRLWPQLFQQAGRGIASGYAGGRYADAFDAGFGGQP